MCLQLSIASTLIVETLNEEETLLGTWIVNLLRALCLSPNERNVSSEPYRIFFSWFICLSWWLQKYWSKSLLHVTLSSQSLYDASLWQLAVWSLACSTRSTNLVDTRWCPSAWQWTSWITETPFPMSMRATSSGDFVVGTPSLIVSRSPTTYRGVWVASFPNFWNKEKSFLLLTDFGVSSVYLQAHRNGVNTL